jgi:FkbM family methyltransferase
MSIKNAIRKLFNMVGYEIQPVNKESRLRRDIGESYAHLKDLGFQPGTVIDVGVASGTEELYQAFPDSNFLLIEALEVFEPDLIAILDRYQGSYVLAAAGPQAGEVTFNMHEDHLAGSSLYKESMGADADGREVTIPMVKVDDIIREKQLVGPYLIKIDTQGAELDVLEGAQEVLAETEAVALEVSLFAFMKGAPQFFEVVDYMKQRGFVVYDIVTGWNRPLDGALGQVDVVFVKEAGRFRTTHDYSTIEQLGRLSNQ